MGNGSWRNGHPARWVRIALALVTLLLAGCGGEPSLPLTEWSMRVDQGPEVRVHLPVHVTLPPRLSVVTLRHDVVLPPSWRGRAVRVRIEGWQGPTRLAVGERPSREQPSAAYRGRGYDAWLLDASETGRGVVPLTLTVSHAWEKSAWLDAVPTIELVSTGAAPPTNDPSWTSRVESVALVLATGLCLTLSFLYGLLYALDRRRREHLWFSLFALASVTYPLFVSTWLASSVGFVEGVVFGVAHATTPVLGLFLTRAMFGAPQPRPAYVGFPLLALAGGLLFARPFETTTFSWVVALAALPPALVHFVVLARLARSRVRHARLLLVTWTVSTLVTAVFEGRHLFGRGLVAWPGIHLGLFSVIALMVTYVYLLVDRHVASQRRIEELNQELRDQVRERTTALSRALGHLLVPGAVAQVGAGDTIDDRYRVISSVGRGGMGSVFLATRLRDARPVAIKVLHGHASALCQARFAREARVASTMNHPNVVRILDVAVAEEGFMYLVMEYVEGSSLAAMKERHGDAVWAVDMLRGVLEALVALHARGIVHRDLKPSNVVVSRQLGREVPKLVDFGLALLSRAPAEAAGERNRPTSATESSTRSLLGGADAARAAGTPLYMAPELVLEGAPASPAADVFSVAVMAHVLLVGRPPFDQPLFQRSVEGPSLPPARAWANTDPALALLLERSLSPDPADRPLARELLAALPAGDLELYA